MLRSKHKARTWPSNKRSKLTSFKQLQPRRPLLQAQKLQLQAASPPHAAPDPHASICSSVAPPSPKQATRSAPPSPARSSSQHQATPSSLPQSVLSSTPPANQHAFAISRSTSVATPSPTSTHATSMIRPSASMPATALPRI